MIAILMLAASAATAVPSDAARSDLTCLEATSWAIASLDGGGSEKQSTRGLMETLRVFYLGRLSGRDEQTNWVGAAQREMLAKSAYEKGYAAAIEPCSQTFLSKASGK